MWFKWFENLVLPFTDEPPTKPPAKTLAFIWHYTKPFKWLLVTGIVVSIIMAVIELAIFGFIGSLVDWLASAERENFLATHLGEIIFMGILTAVIWPLLALIDDTIMHQGMMGNFAMQIRWRGHRYMLRQSTQFFADDFAGRIATKVMQTALGVRDTVMQLTTLYTYVGAYAIGAIVMFAASDWRLSIPILLWMVAYGIVMRFFLPRLQKISEAQSDARSVLTGRVVDAYSNIQTVKLFSSNQDEDKYAREGMEIMLDPVYKQMRMATQLSFWLHFLNGLLIASTIGIGLWLWSINAVAASALAVSTALLMRLQGMSHWFIWEVAGLFENIGAVEDGMGTIAKDIAVKDPETPTSFEEPKGSIIFKDLSFHYGKEKGVLEKFNLEIKEGEKVGLIGRSGAGKSTLINLLLRLYDPEKGRIEINKTDIKSVLQEDLRRNIAVVSQDTSLLHRSIRENIAYGMPEASEEDIIKAARQADADSFIPELTDGKDRTGYEAHVGERGVKLSGGQRQRIAIARVILKNAPILVLDEATSALDSEAEAAIQEQLDSLMAGKTVIATAHRLSTIAAMDRLIVLDQGQIIEDGTHDSLLAQDGVYASLWKRQSGGFLIERPKPKEAPKDEEAY